MMLHHKAFQFSALLGFLPAANALTATPADGVNILNDVDGNVGSNPIEVFSNVPVNLDKYFGSGNFFYPGPMEPGQVKVLVTSDCDTSQHNVDALMDIDATTGKITVILSVEDGSGAAMPFLTPSSFDAEWEIGDPFCGDQQALSAAGDCDVCVNPKTGVCEASLSSCFIDPCDESLTPCAEGQSCESNYCGGCHALCSGGETTTTVAPTTPAAIPDDPSCQPNAECFSEGSTCSVGEETCCGQTFESMKCECANTNGNLEYICMYTDACLYPPCCLSGPPANENPPVSGTCEFMGELCDTGVADDYCCFDSSGSGASYCTVTGGTPAISEAFPSEATVATTTSATKPSSSGDPTSTKDNGGSAAFSQQRCYAASFLALVLVSLLLPGRDNNAQGLLGFGAVAVAAIALSSVVPKKNGSARNNVERAISRTRGLQTCSFNVEVLYDGCVQSVSVDAPSARVIDVKTENFTSTSVDTCTTSESVTLTFPVTDTTMELDLSVNNTVDKMDEFSLECALIIMGRPYIDSTGMTLKAVPIAPDMKEMNSLTYLPWSGEVVVDDDESVSSSNNVTRQDQLSLGREWTERALSEHASVASFSAFAVALMTNNAPSDLVEDALKAGMDEIRHARTSFEIASKLVGKSVGPGPLPPSTHKFGHDLTSLALAVAREGCVDETLSAIIADLEMEDISKVLKEGAEGSIYSNIEPNTLEWIMNEMRTIASEESSHAALAWRTLNWVCDVDSDACEAVDRDVFGEKLELRFDQRAMKALSDTLKARYKLKEDWMKIHDAYRLLRSNVDASHIKSTCSESEDRLGAIPSAVLSGLIC